MKNYEYHRIGELKNQLEVADVGAEIIEQIMEGGESVLRKTSPAKKADWMRGAMFRMNKLLDMPTRKTVREGCACCLGGQRLKTSQAIAKENKTLEARIKAANKAHYVGSVIMQENGEILARFDLQNQEPYHCYCLPKAEKPLPITYCYCCGGHVKHHLQIADDPKDYDTLLCGKTIGAAAVYGALVEIQANDARLLFGDGVALRFHPQGEKRPQKHQLLIEFLDGSAISGSVQMYGGLWCFKEGEYHNHYYEVAKTKPSPLSEEFDWAYFNNLIATSDIQKLSAKAFLATEQRIPGLGNGVLQDILYIAKIHPKRRVEELTGDERKSLYHSVKSTLKEMAAQGGRNTEKDIFGNPGGYITRLSKNTIGKPCPVCGGMITKQPYMGGSIYFCAKCQKF
jgi:formamidopyrimidine-DNA glycosylase